MVQKVPGILREGQKDFLGHILCQVGVPNEAQGSGKYEINMPPQSVIAKSNAQLMSMPSPDVRGKNRPHGSLEWPALKRMLDRRDPSYKT